MSREHSPEGHQQRPDIEDGETWALALSGGGIRSATFALGLIRSLAKNGLLSKFDYLSTVSGGGYIGAAIGRLYQKGQTASQVEQGLAADDTTLLWWLRRNGRYLEPAGARDILQATASQLRGLVTAQIEAGILLVGVALLAVVPNVSWGGASQTFPLLWWLMGIAALIINFLTILGYWVGGRTAVQRVRWTNLLANSMLLTLGVTSLVALQEASARIAHFWISDGHFKSPAYMLPPGMLAVLLFARKLIRRKGNSAIKLAKISIQQWLQILGLAMLVFIVLAWATLFQVVFQSLPSWGLGSAKDTGLWWWAFAGLTLMAAACSQYAGLESLNLSSLHNFYRARLERAYISVGNYTPQGNSASGQRFRQSPLQPSTGHKPLMRLNEASEADDVQIQDYRPERHGGPTHLINCTINQTVDDRTGSYNADRKGVALTISATGFEIGTGSTQELPPAWKSIGLSRWIAISGAAVSTGLGSLTSTGLAILLFLGNIRLGYWISSPPPKAEAGALPHRLWISKIKGVCAELFGHFPGLQSSAWYLSDGGHFENTAVYALIKRKCRLIIVSDAGADHKYEYEDLANMVRKVRIDYNAQIDFIEQPCTPYFGSLASLKDHPVEPQLLLARITYSDGSLGTMIVAKPHRIKNWPLDLVDYAKSDPEFPQNTTLDQFFSEAQWEAYHQLGLSIGRLLDQNTISKAIQCTKA